MTTKTKVAIAALAVAGSVFAFRKIRTLITAKEPEQKKGCQSADSIDLNNRYDGDCCEEAIGKCCDRVECAG